MMRPARQLLVLLTVLATAGAAVGAPAAAGDDPGRTAVLLTISSATVADLVLPVDAVRAAALEQLRRNLTVAGADPLPAAELDAAAGHWRVRSDWALDRPFLDHLADDLGVRRLQAVHLRIEQQQLSLTARLLSCPDGRLLRVDLPAVATPAAATPGGASDPAAWRAALIRLCAAVPAAAPPAAAAPTLLVLPAEGIGCEEDRALTATACLLSRLLAEGRWSLPDPGLLAATLHRAGVAPQRLGARGRRLLREEFRGDTLLRLTLAAYGGSAPAPARRIIDDAPLAGRTPDLEDFDLSLRRIDLTDGTVSGSRNLFVPAGSDEGWFGVIHRRSPLERIDKAAGTLWQEFRNHLEDR